MYYNFTAVDFVCSITSVRQLNHFSKAKAMKNTDTIYDDNGTTRFIFRHNKGACSGTTKLTVDEAKEAIKGVDLPTSRLRAEKKADRLKTA